MVDFNDKNSIKSTIIPLFFSGGSALKELSIEFAKRDIFSFHIITSFDSGGSSAPIRDYFKMISVGDIRHRMCALSKNSEMSNLFSYRFSKESSNREILSEITLLLKKIDNNKIKGDLEFFLHSIPKEFPLQNGSLGNFIITGGYLKNGRDWDKTLDEYHKILYVCGKVIPISEDFADIITYLDSGEVISKQHLITGKEVTRLKSPIKKIELSESTKISKRAEEAIFKADLIVFPIGSFYSSLIVNFLVDGVLEAILNNSCEKIWIPNYLQDYEAYDLTIENRKETLLRYLNPNKNKKIEITKVITDIFNQRGLLDISKLIRVLGLE
ncbi:YvcK family protein [bacterium]|nr:YvcK family protein [bacterium]